MSIKKSFWSSAHCEIFPNRVNAAKLFGPGVKPWNTLITLILTVIMIRSRRPRLLLLGSVSKITPWIIKIKRRGFWRDLKIIVSSLKGLSESDVRHIDHVIVFCKSRIALYAPEVQHKCIFIPLSINTELSRFVPTGSIRRDAYIFTGGGAGRDFESLIEAVRDTNIPVNIITFNPAKLLNDMDIPSNCQIEGVKPSSQFMGRIAQARLIVLPLIEGDEAHGHTTLIQSMSLGKAIITTKNASLDDYVRDRQEVIMVNPGDITAYREAIMKLWSDDALRQSLGSAAKQRSVDFTHDKQALHLAQACKTILDIKSQKNNDSPKRKMIWVMGMQRSGGTALMNSFLKDSNLDVYKQIDSDLFYHGPEHYLRPEPLISSKLDISSQTLVLEPKSETKIREVADVLNEFTNYDVRIIWNYRHPFDVFISRQQKYPNQEWTKDIDRFIELWNKRNQSIINVLNNQKSNITIIKLEDIIKEPSVYNQLCVSIGIKGNYIFRRYEKSFKNARQGVSEDVQRKISEGTAEVWSILEERRSFKPQYSKNKQNVEYYMEHGFRLVKALSMRIAVSHSKVPTSSYTHTNIDTACSDKEWRQPLVSIVMPAWNAERTIGEAISSILEQSYLNWELLVIDDASTDGTAKIAREFDDSRIKVLDSRTHTSATVCINRGIAAANGDYIARMDADDLSLPERLVEQMNYLLRHPEIDVLGTGSYLVNADNWTIGQIEYPLTDYEIKRFISTETQQAFMCHPSLLMRRSALEAINAYDESLDLAQDKDLIIRLAENGYKLANIKTCLVMRRRLLKGIDQKRLYKEKSNLWLGCVYEKNKDIIRLWKKRYSHLPKACKNEVKKMDMLTYKTSRLNDVKLRIAMITNEFPVGEALCSGLSHYMQRVSKSLTQEGCEIHVVAESDKAGPIWERDGMWLHTFPKFNPSRPIRYTLIKLGLYGLAVRIRFNYKVYRTLMNINKSRPLDIVQYTNVYASGFLSSIFLKIPSIVRVSSDRVLWQAWSSVPRVEKWLGSWMEHLQLRMASNIYVPSKNIQTLLQRKFPQKKIDKLAGPIDIEIKDFDYSLVNKLNEKPFILYFGGFKRSKGFEVLIRALPEFLNQNPETQVVLIGKDRADEILPSMTDFARLTLGQYKTNLHIYKPLAHSQLYPFIQNAKLIVLPSLVDNLPNTCLEAMSLGKPVLGTYGTSLDELIEHQQTGFLAPANDIDALCKLMCEAWNSPKLEAIGRKAKESVAALSGQRMTPKLMKLYDSAIINFYAEVVKKPHTLNDMMWVVKKIRGALRRLWGCVKRTVDRVVNHRFYQIKKQCNGMLNASVYKEVYHYAQGVESGSLIEVGSAQGAATVSLGLGIRSKGRKINLIAFERGEQSNALQSWTSKDDNMRVLERNLIFYNLERTVQIIPQSVDDAYHQIMGEQPFGLLMLDSDGAIDRAFDYFYNALLPGAPIIIDDYEDKKVIPDSIKRPEQVVAYVKSKGVQSLKDLCPLGKHYTTYKLLNYFINKGWVQKHKVIRNTFFGIKPKNIQAPLKWNKGETQRIREDILKEYEELIAKTGDTIYSGHAL